MNANRLAIWFVLAVAAPAIAQPQVRLATLAPSGTVFHQELQAMGEKWRAAPGGGVRLTIFTNGTQGSEQEMVRRMANNQLQAAMLTVSGLSYIDESVASLQNMPMMFRSTDELEYVREKLRPRFEQKFKEKGFVVLFWGDAGWIRFFSQKPATTPEEFKKFKMFTLAGNSQTTDVWKLAGFRPVELQMADILTGLSTGLVDAVPSEPYYALMGQFYSKAPHMLDLKWAPLVGATVMTQRSFDALPPATRTVIQESAIQTGKKLTLESRARSEESVTAMKTKNGLIVHEVTPELEARWRKLCEEFYPKIRGSIVPADMFDEVQKLLDEHRKTGGKAG